MAALFSRSITSITLRHRHKDFNIFIYIDFYSHFVINNCSFHVRWLFGRLNAQTLFYCGLHRRRLRCCCWCWCWCCWCYWLAFTWALSSNVSPFDRVLFSLLLFVFAHSHTHSRCVFANFTFVKCTISHTYTESHKHIVTLTHTRDYIALHSIEQHTTPHSLSFWQGQRNNSLNNNGKQKE